MQILKELAEIITEDTKKKKVTRRMAGAVYHRDYTKTKNRPYRKYQKSQRGD